MFPPVPVQIGDGSSGLSYSGVFIKADREQALAELAPIRFTGYLGPQEGDWVLAVSGNPGGKVAGDKRRVDDVGRDIAVSLQTCTLAVDVDAEERLRLWGFDGERALPAYDSAPPQDDGGAMQLDDFGNPIVADTYIDTDAVAEALLETFGAEDPDGALIDHLDDDLGEDTNESERLVAILRIIGLPTWIVSSDSLPRRVPGGPDKGDVTRLGSGKTGVKGRLAQALSKPSRPKPKRPDR